MNSQPTFQFLTNLNLMNYDESNNSLTFLELKSPDIPALCETNLDDSIHSGNISAGGYVLLI